MNWLFLLLKLFRPIICAIVAEIQARKERSSYEEIDCFDKSDRGELPKNFIRLLGGNEMAGVGGGARCNTLDVFFTRFISNLFLRACSVEENAKLKIINNFYQSSQTQAIRVSCNKQYNSNHFYCFYVNFDRS